MTKLKTSFDKNISIILSIIVLLISFSIMMPLSADAWDGSAATSFASGSGTETSPYVINTEKQMGYFMNRINSGVTFEGQYIKLNANLDMTGGNWEITSGKYFAGTFLGNNKTLTMDSNFLDRIAETGKVDWLNIQGYGTVNDPLMCYYNYGTIQNCRVSGDVSKPGYSAGLLCTENTKTGLVINSCGFGSVYGSADDDTCYVGWVSKSEGTIKNCYAVISVDGDASGRYETLYTGIITAKGTYENCYHSSDVIANDASFVSKLNSFTGIPGYIWSVDSSNVNNGYPVIKECLSAVTNVSGYSDSIVVFNSTTFSATLTSSVSGCTIYYTLDGTDPTTSSTRKTYSRAFTISSDTVVTSVAYKNGSYGMPTRQQVVQLLGSGTTTSPYIVSSNMQLNAIRLNPDKIYELTRDLDFTNEPKIYQGENWVTIPSFSGELRGGGHSITGLTSINGGLVHSNTGIISELRLIDHNLRVYDTYTCCGAIANSNSGTITRCYAGTQPNGVTSVSDSSLDVGGIAGYNSGTISYCSTSGKIRVESSWGYTLGWMGGIAGYGRGTVSRCYSDVKMYTPHSAHDLGLTVGGIACGNDVYDCRFDGTCVIDSYLASFGVGSATRGGGRGYSYRIFDGGATFYSVGSSNREYYTEETDLYSYKSVYESSYPAFDFNNVWMITADGPMPQGVMMADGRCMAKYSYTEPTCTSVGYAVSYDMMNTSYRKTETFSMVSHSYSATVNSCVGTKTFTCKCGDTYIETIPVEHYADVGYIENSTSYPYTLSNGKYTSTNKTSSSSSDFYIRVQRDCTLTIKYGVSSESNCDWLTIYHNSTQKDRISGEVSEKTLTISLVAGDYIKITYSKDGSIDRGNNNGWFSIVAGEQVQSGSVISVPMSSLNSTCTGDIVCNNCDEKLQATSHTEVVDVAVAPTCTATGLTEGKRCSVCNEVLVAQTVVDALGHSYNAVVTTPDCVNGGYTTYTCHCGDSYVSDEVSALGHSYNTVVTAPDCVNGGYTTYTCHCGDSYVSDEVSALGHSYNTVVTAPDCVNGGYTTYTCHCGDSYVSDEVSALGHSYNAVVTAPDCVNGGYTTYTCHCGYTYVDDEVSALGHTESSAFNENYSAPSCIADGSYESVVCCTACDIELSRTTIVVVALGHTEVIDAAIASTCTETGLTEGKHCSVCNEILVATMATPALGHTDADKDFFCDVCNADLCTEHSEEIIDSKAATCTESGLTEGKKCSICGEIIVKQEVIPANGHKYEASETKPTCTDAGYTTYSCTACDYSYTADEVDALGHDWLNATCDAPETCSVCDATNGEALGHNWLDATTDAPKTCDRCGATDGDKLPEMPEHPSDDTPATDETPDEDKPEDEECEKDHSKCLEEASGGNRFWNAIGNFFRRIFSKYVKCVCGDKVLKKDYTEFKKLFKQNK